jgi:small subunit ribosomal protein S5
MAEEQKTQTTPAPTQTAPEAGAGARPARRPRPDGQGQGGPSGARGKNPRRFGGERAAKPKPEFDQKIIDIRRVTRVVSGGRRFSFSVALVAGDRKGNVGVGIGKAGDTALAIDKAMKNAKKNMIKIPTTKTMSIPYEVSAKFNASYVTLTPAKGRGIVAGSSVRTIVELAGLKDVGAKLRSPSKNRLNNARAAIEAFKMLTPHRRVLLSRRAGVVKQPEVSKEVK